MNHLRSQNTDISHMERMNKKLYYIWVGDRQIPDQCKRYMDTWVKIKDVDIVPIGNECEGISLTSPFLRKAFHEENWCNVSNYMRAYAMYHWGGIYMDTDVEVVRDSDVWRSEAVNLAMESSHWLNSHVMIAHEPGNIIFKHMLDCMDYFAFPGEVPLELESGPRLITQVMKNRGYELSECNTAHSFQKIVIHPPKVFSPHAWNHKFHKGEIKPETLAVHHFTKLW